MMMKFFVLPKTFAAFLFLLFTLELKQVAKASSNFSERCENAVQCILNSGRDSDCPVVPVPPSSRSNFSIAQGSFELKLLRKGVWFYNDGTVNSLMLLESDHLTLIDFPRLALSPVPDPPIIAAIRQLLNGLIPSRVDMIYSHAHFDHIGSSQIVFNFLQELNPRAKIQIWGTLETFTLIKSSSSNSSIPPNIIVEKRGATLRMSRFLQVRMDIVGGHTVQDLRIYIPPSRSEPGIVLYIDVVFPGYVAPFTFALTEDLRSYIQAQRDILELNFEIIVPGHVGVGNRRDVSENIMYVEDVLSAARVGIDSVTPERLEQAGIGRVADANATEFGNVFFPLINVLRPLEIDTCFKIVLEKWGCRLGAVDLSARLHCFTAISFLNVEV